MYHGQGDVFVYKNVIAPNKYLCQHISQHAVHSRNCAAVFLTHYSDVIMNAIGSQITGVLIVCSTVRSGADQRKHQKLRVTGLCEGKPAVTDGFPHKAPVTRKCFHLMTSSCICCNILLWIACKFEVTWYV